MIINSNKRANSISKSWPKITRRTKINGEKEKKPIIMTMLFRKGQESRKGTP